MSAHPDASPYDAERMQRDVARKCGVTSTAHQGDVDLGAWLHKPVWQVAEPLAVSDDPNNVTDEE